MSQKNEVLTHWVDLPLSQRTTSCRSAISEVSCPFRPMTTVLVQSGYLCFSAELDKLCGFSKAYGSSIGFGFSAGLKQSLLIIGD